MIATEAVQERVQIPLAVETLSAERIAYLEELVNQAKTAAAVFSQFTQEDVDRIVKAMVLAGLEQAQHLARLAVEETKLGVMEDKVLKNMVATEFVYNYIKDKRTVGIIREFPERNLIEMAEPIGVIFSVTPITNPTSTVLFKCIMAIKTRNAVIFSPHPKAWHCCSETVRIMDEIALKHGAPEGVFSCLESPTLLDNAFLMKHKDVGLIDATGGPGMVKAAYSSGKPALGVGAGNTPVYLEKTADLNTAVVDIVVSKTFDNGTICASEQTVVIDDEIYEAALQKFADLGAHICNEKETKELERTVIDPQTGFMQPMAVGQKAADIARFAGLSVKPNTKLLIAPIHGVGREHPLSVEKLFPVLGVYRAKSVAQMGHVDIVRRNICPNTHVHVQVIPDAEPEVKIIAQGVEALNFYKADQIIALGGGSVIDAAKIMKLKYESPEADLEYLAAPFLDLRKRVVQYPTEKINRARLIAISTTSGTGSEVTPFAVLTDKASGRKVTLADYSLTPDVAIVDPQFVMSMPKGLTADTGIDCLTHALEAGVSNYASPYTDSSAMQAIRLVFKYLPIAYEYPRDEEARCMMHNAACIAAMAFSNASVGVNHALAHAFGARFGVPHGRANALMLPHVMAYNAAVPTKFMPSPYTQGYLAHKKYATVADLLGLGGHTVEEKVKNLIEATEQLLDKLGFQRSIAELGISREDFERAVPELASIAFDDPSWRSNPRMPLMSELVELFWKAYEGRSVAKVAEVSQQTV